MKLLKEEPMLKSDLARLMKINPKTLYRNLKRWENEIKENFEYEPSSKLLYPNVINFIIEKTGYSWDDENGSS